ncbi:MAG: DinB family protein [Calditrichaeota bacterium]|nr:DinB family protein [Calditrichota bacterium]MCB9369598.1 DinB family protein [Calditrichota bacterium]
MTTQDLIAQLNFAHFVITVNYDGISEEMANQEPKPSGNPFNRVLGHIIATRMPLFRVFDLKHPWNEKQANVYNGPWDNADKSQALSFDDLKRLENETFDQLKSAVENFSGDWDAHYPESKPERPQTYGQRVTFFLLHECYHAGQLASIRRSLGLPGMLK